MAKSQARNVYRCGAVQLKDESRHLPKISIDTRMRGLIVEEALA